MLERDRPDLIVSRACVPDIDGVSLCAIVRNEHVMAGVRFLLVADPGDELPEGAVAGRPDRILVGEFTAAAIVSEVTNLLAGHPAAAGTRREPPLPAAPPDPTHDLPRSAGVMAPPRLAHAIAPRP